MQWYEYIIPTCLCNNMDYCAAVTTHRDCTKPDGNDVNII